MQSDSYWSGLEYAPNTSFAWSFNSLVCYQFFDFKGDALYALAVRPGDVAAAVPEPQSLALWLGGLTVVRAVRRRRPR